MPASEREDLGLSKKVAEIRQNMAKIDKEFTVKFTSLSGAMKAEAEEDE